MTYAELCRRRIEHLERQGPPEKPTKETVAEYAYLEGIGKREAWKDLRELYEKQLRAHHFLITTLKSYT